MIKEEGYNQELPEVEPTVPLPNTDGNTVLKTVLKEGAVPKGRAGEIPMPVEEGHLPPLGAVPVPENPKEYEPYNAPTAPAINPTGNATEEFSDYIKTSLPLPPTRSPRVASPEYASGTPSATEPTGTEVELEEQRLKRTTTSEQRTQQRTQQRSKRLSGATVAGGALGVTSTVIAGGAGATIAYVLLFA